MSENLADELIEFLFDDYTSLDRYIKLYDECEGVSINQESVHWNW